ncbi:MAG: cupin domain-containing protein [Pseudomonadota bacterium]
MNTFDIEDTIRRDEAADYRSEYNCHLWRLFPWKNRVETHRPLTGMGIIKVIVRPGEAILEHVHDEEEVFIMLAGRGILEIESQTAELHAGDIAYIPRNIRHSLVNEGTEDVCFFDVYWDNRDANSEL